MMVNAHIQIIKPIKQGGIANLYLGVDLFDGTQVAVKELKSGYFKNPEVRKKFIDEANQYLYLEHPNIVKLKDFIDKGNTQYLVMEFIDGHDLSDYVKKVSGPLPIFNIALLMNEVLSALSYIHRQNLVHLDIKPSNIMLSKDNRVKVIDFGIAHDTTQGGMKIIMGSPYYMSPEQIKGKSIDHRSDIYSVGITIFELLTGQLPFSDCKTNAELAEAINTKPLPRATTQYSADFMHEEKINSILHKATLKDPNARYQTCDELQTELLPFL